MNIIDYSAERYWEDVSVGEDVPGFSVQLDATAMVLQVSGSQDWNLVHHDTAFAQESGMSGIFYNTGWTTGMLGRLLTDWAGRSGWVEKLSFQMRGMNSSGAMVRAYAKVTDKRREDSKTLVDLDIFLENDQVGVTTPGRATVRLPSRSKAARQS
jgi:3-oxo-4,17-pregnadiene-20-carboxyl-CoA hydratase beta subunit